MNPLEISRIVNRKYRPCIVCTNPECRLAIEGPEMNMEALNENWLDLVTTACQIATEEAKPCFCVANGKIKEDYGITIIDVQKKTGVPVQQVLSPQNIALTRR